MLTRASAWRLSLAALVALALLPACLARTTPPSATATAAPVSTDPPPPQVLTVTGSGRVVGETDVAAVTFGYWTKDQDPDQALLSSKTRLADIHVQLSALGVDPADMQNLGYSMNSEFIIGPDGYPTEALLYAVNQWVSLTVRDQGQVGAVLKAIQSIAGAPYLYGLSVNQDFSASRRAAVLAQAQAQAVADAHANAQRLAQSLGLALGEAVEAVILTQEFTNSPPLLANVTVRVVYAVH